MLWSAAAALLVTAAGCSTVGNRGGATAALPPPPPPTSAATATAVYPMAAAGPQQTMDAPRGRAPTGPLTEALSSAYNFSPALNSARAGARATDEAVPLAKAPLRPTFTGSGGVTSSVTDPNTGPASNTTTSSLSLSASQAIFSGFRNRNAIRGAEATIQASQASLVNAEQNVLFDAAAAYVAVVRDNNVLRVRRADVDFLKSSVQAAKDRFDAGQATVTDVSQAEARLAGAESQVSVAMANLRSSEAEYRRVIGAEPKATQVDFQFGYLIPDSLEQAALIAEAEHPVILSAVYQADSSAYGVKQIEGALLPSVSVSGSVSHTHGLAGTSEGTFSDSASVGASLSVPIYQGGAVSAQVRQAKELLGQSKIEIDLARDQVRAAVVSAWGQWISSKDAVIAAAAQVKAAESSLYGVEEEQKVGERTTLDVLDAQRDLLQAQLNEIQIRSNRVLASFALLSATGRLTAEHLGLPVHIYRPDEHYQAVKNKWFGLRTPDGR